MKNIKLITFLVALVLCLGVQQSFATYIEGDWVYLDHSVSGKRLGVDSESKAIILGENSVLGPQSQWRFVKVYKDFCYINQNETGERLYYDGEKLSLSSKKETGILAKWLVVDAGDGTSYIEHKKTKQRLKLNTETGLVSMVPAKTSGDDCKWKIVEMKSSYPSDIMPGIVNWKISLPVDKDGNDNTNIDDVNQRNKHSYEVGGEELINFEMPPYFEVRNGEVVFRGHCAGATTRGSKYPRSELRQLVGGGNNYWSVQKYQKLVVDLRVTHLPNVKPEVCMVQIHGPEDEPMRVQYSATDGLKLVWNEKNKIKFRDEVSYELGQELRVTTIVSLGYISCIVENLDTNETFTYKWKSSDETGYFKVGCYTQSTKFLDQIKDGYKAESPDAYGEVTVSRIVVEETY